MAVCGYSHLQSFILMFMVFINFLLLIPFAHPLSFRFSRFDPNNDHDMEYQGDAFPLNSTIKLTMDQNGSYINWSSGRVTYSKPVQLGNKTTGTLIDFITDFSFFVTPKDQNSSGDGLVFFLAANRSLPSNSSGECLGIVNCNNKFNSSENPFVAIEFDNYKNSWDPNYDHFGININSISSVVTGTWLSESRQANARVKYDSDSKTLTVFLTYDDMPNSIYNIFHVVDLREYLPEWVTVGFSAAVGGSLQIHTLMSWDFNSSLAIVDAKSNVTESVEPPKSIGNRLNSKDKKILKSVIPIGVFVLVFVSCLIWFFYKKNQRIGVEMPMNGTVNAEEQAHGTVNYDDAARNDMFGKNKYGPKRYSFNELAEATGNFAKEGIIGKGGFGIVYKGFLRELNMDVAIKRFSEGSSQGIKEYETEVNIISRLKHRNLVELFGYYHDEEQNDLILVYEFMPNGSLHDHLFNEKICLLTWEKRYNIALDLARGLNYLHEGGEQYVVHRDIKSANVLLGLSFKAKLGDFGLARLVEQGNDPLTTYKAGTKGYLAPECAIYGQKPSKESDVYSFGIVLLEIGCGKKALEYIEGRIQEVVEWVWKLYGKGNILEAADIRLSEFNQNQMERLLLVGLCCAHPQKMSRPSIQRALHMLLFEEATATLPYVPPEMPERSYYAPSLHTISESSSSENFVTPPTRFTKTNSNIHESQLIATD